MYSEAIKSGRSNFKRPSLFATLLVLSLLYATGLAQQTTGNIRGLVKDQVGAVVPNAKITLTNARTNETYTATSGGEGEFQFNNLLVGDYTIRIEVGGFNTLVLNDVRVVLNQTTDVPAAMSQ